MPETKCVMFEEATRNWAEERIFPCEVCEQSPSSSRHHLVPKELGGTQTIRICRQCHALIHRNTSNADLADKYYTVEKLKELMSVLKYSVI